jgi:pimeloyl-ACP methyl ester carboxylesterase
MAMQLYFQTHGQGEPLLILHGLFGSLENWHSVSLALAHHFHVFAVDQRNHGRSPHSPEMSYSLMAGDLRELLAAQGLTRAHVLGHSMGGKTAMQFALLHPAQVNKLIVVDIAPHAYPPLHEKVFKALLPLDLGEYQTRKQIEETLAPALPELALRQFLLKNLARDSAGAFYWRNGLREIRANYERLGAALGGEHPCERPTLFLRGEQSDYLQPEDLPAIHHLFPQAQLQTIPEAGHLPHTENRAAFLEAVLGFLQGEFFQSF